MQELGGPFDSLIRVQELGCLEFRVTWIRV